MTRTNGNGVDTALDRPLRCAIYTRKSTDEGLDNDFNTLHAQREAAEAYIKSQAQAGWTTLPEQYDDGGFSGATLERPALKRLLEDMEGGKVDCVVVYKVDRLSRSLLDFSRMVELFDRKGVSFVSVTQQFNTTNSMGRLTLNILLSFAQFEREVIAERIRDKFAASRKRGKHMGGTPVLGYDIDRAQKRLVVNPEEVKLVRHIFERFLEIGSVTALTEELIEKGYTTKAWTTVKGRVREGKPWNKGNVYRLLNNVLYIGEVNHLGSRYPGEQEALIDRKTWDKVQALLASRYHVRDRGRRTKSPVLLQGFLRCTPCGCGMQPTYSMKHGKIYRYYVCMKATKIRAAVCPLRRVAVRELEGVVIGQLRQLLRSPESLMRVLAAKEDQAPPADGEAAVSEGQGVSPEPGGNDDRVMEPAVRSAAASLDGLWDDLFPAERARIVRLVIERVGVSPEEVELQLRPEGLQALLAEVGGAPLREVG